MVIDRERERVSEQERERGGEKEGGGNVYEREAERASKRAISMIESERACKKERERDNKREREGEKGKAKELSVRLG